MGYVVLLKKKSAQKWQKAIKIRAGTTLSNLRKKIKRDFAGKLNTRIINLTDFRKMLKNKLIKT